jgi:hypothetical protein
MEAGTLDAGVRVWVGERRFVLLERRMRKASETGLSEKRSAGGGGKWRLEEATARRRKVVGGVGGGGGGGVRALWSVISFIRTRLGRTLGSTDNAVDGNIDFWARLPCRRGWRRLRRVWLRDFSAESVPFAPFYLSPLGFLLRRLPPPPIRAQHSRQQRDWH